jgi:hypothetical protein
MLVLSVVTGGRLAAFPRVVIFRPRTCNASVAFIIKRSVNGSRLLPLVRLRAVLRFVLANLFRLLGSKRVRTSARLSQRASRAAWETVPGLPSLVLISKKFPEELPEFPQDGTPQASLRELLTWHAELSRASYAYRELRASYDTAIVQAGLAAERLVAGDALCHKLWDHYLHLTGLRMSSDPSLSCSSSKGKDRALSISSDDEEQDTNDDDDDDDGGDGGDHWSRLSRSEDNDRDAGAGGANAGAGAMDTS